MMAPPRFRSSLLPLALVLSAGGCGGAEDASDPPARVEIPPPAIVASFGALSDTTGIEVMRSVSAAALSESGRYLAVGDRSPPFLRLLDRAMGRASRLGREGDGPGELRSVWGLEFLGDSVLLVLSRGQRLERFTTDGTWLGTYNLTMTGVMVSSVTEGCGGRIFVYGVPGEHRQMDTVPWVHELHLEEETPSASPQLAIPGRGYHLGWGALYGFDGATDGVLLWHRAKEPQIGYWLDCDGGPAAIWSHTASPEEGLQAAFDLDDGRGGMALTLPDTVFSGAAARGATRIRTRRALEPSDGVQVTSFHVVGDGRCHEVELVGQWTLHDAHADGLVLATPEPFPAVRVIAWSWFERQLTPAPCSPVATY